MRFKYKTEKIVLELTKSPTECSSKEEIREQIDLIDQEIIRLFGIRFQYVSNIVQFKTDTESVVAQDRKNEVIRVRGEWAKDQGLDQKTYEELYRFLIDHNIGKELEILRERFND